MLPDILLHLLENRQWDDLVYAIKYYTNTNGSIKWLIAWW